MDDCDLILARQLQEEFDRETANAISYDGWKYDADQYGKSSNNSSQSNSKPLSVIDTSWELTDPNPDVRALFLQFNDQYFWGRLAGVEVKWSPRMTLCAGVCSYEGRGGLCSIRLSVPLLKLRPRKDLVETLLHEMIHAYLFVTENDRDRDGHGPNFQKHMHRINKASGAKITIYHDFHDEVDNYRQHWWRCNGPCQKWKPYFGFVKRAMNRAPSSRDFWWEEHQRKCGGTYTKVKEPEGYGVKKKGGKEEKEDSSAEQSATGSMDIRSFLGKGNVLGGCSQQSKILDGSKGSKKTSTITSTTTSVSSSNTNGLSNAVKGKSVADNKTQGATKTTTLDSLFKAVGSKKNDSVPKVKPVATGIWADEIRPVGDDFSDRRMETEQILDREISALPSLRDGKTWAVAKPASVLETRRDEQVVNTSSDSGGNTLGSGPVGLNWLSTMRKQWAASATSTSASKTETSLTSAKVPKTETTSTSASTSAPATETSVTAIDKNAGPIGQTATRLSEKPSSGKLSVEEERKDKSDLPKAEAFSLKTSFSEKMLQPLAKASTDRTLQSKTNLSIVSVSDDDDFGIDDSSNQNSANFSAHSSAHNDSFHVSSCDEDKWPTPVSYKKKLAWHSHMHSSPVISLQKSPLFKGKRTVTKTLSSDDEEEDVALPSASKRLKFSPVKSKTLYSEYDSISNGDGSNGNVFKRVKAVNEFSSSSKDAKKTSTVTKSGARIDSPTDGVHDDELETEQKSASLCKKTPSDDVSSIISEQISGEFLADLTNDMEPNTDPHPNPVSPTAPSTQQSGESSGAEWLNDSDMYSHQSDGNNRMERVSDLGNLDNLSPDDIVIMGEETSSDAGGSLVPCPVCQKKVSAAGINDHLDLCLTRC